MKKLILLSLTVLLHLTPIATMDDKTQKLQNLQLTLQELQIGRRAIIHNKPNMLEPCWMVVKDFLVQTTYRHVLSIIEENEKQTRQDIEQLQNQLPNNK